MKHGVVGFDPAAYTVLDYADNRRPQYYGQGIEAYREEVAEWQRYFESYLGADWVRKIHRCNHCGNGRIRYVTIVEHADGERMIFGADCTAHLDFAGADAFKLARLQKRAAANRETMRQYQLRQKFEQDHPEVAGLVERYRAGSQDANGMHYRNGFAGDVVMKFQRYGTLSDRQIEALRASLDRDAEMHAKREADRTRERGPAPSGRCDMVCTVLSVQKRDTDFGIQHKLLVEFENGARGWVTAPSRFLDEQLGRDSRVTLRANWTPSKDDPSFAFGNRPHLVG